MKKFLALLLTACMVVSACFVTGMVASADDALYDYYYVKGSTNKNALSYSGNDDITFNFQLLKTRVPHDDSGHPILTNATDGSAVEGATYNYKIVVDNPTDTIAPSHGKTFYTDYPVQSTPYVQGMITTVDSNPAGNTVVAGDAVKEIISQPGYAGYVYLIADFITEDGIHQNYQTSVAVNFDKIKKTVAEPSDFASYWEGQLADLGVIDNENEETRLNVVTATGDNAAATFTEYTKANYEAYREYWGEQNKKTGVTVVIDDVTNSFPGLIDTVNYNVYDVKLETKGTIYQSDRTTGEVYDAGGLPVCGYVAIPKNNDGTENAANDRDDGSCKIRVDYMGYGFATALIPVQSTNTISAFFNNCGLPNGLGDQYAQIRKDFPDQTTEFDDFLNTDKNTAYYNGTVRRVVRSLQYLENMPGWKVGNDITVHGLSYGGFQAVVAAALDHNVTQCNPEVAWMCNIGSPDYGCVSSGFIPNFSTDSVRVFNENGMLDQEHSYLNLYDYYLKASGTDAEYSAHRNEDGSLKTLTQNSDLLYYDTASFASLIQSNCNVLMQSQGLGDDLCPSFGETVLYNTLKAKADAGTLKGLSAYFYQDGRHGNSPTYSWYANNFAQSNIYLSVKTAIPHVIFENNVATINPGANENVLNSDLFKGNTNLKSLVINTPIDTIWHEGLRECTNLESISFGEGAYVKHIEASALMSNNKLTSLSLPEGLEKIDGYALQNTGITTITLPGAAAGKTVTYENGCLDNIANLSKVVINDSLSNTNASDIHWDTNALPFWKDYSDVTVTVSEASPLYTQINTANLYGARAEANRYTVNPNSIVYENGILTINSGVASIDSARLDSTLAVYNAQRADITKLVIDGAKISVDRVTFQNCSNLAEIEFKNGGCFTTIGEAAFNACAIKTLSLPEGLVEIQNQAFNGSGLEELTIPAGQINLAQYSLCSVQTLKVLTFAGTLADGSVYTIASDALLDWGIGKIKVYVDVNLPAYETLKTINASVNNKLKFNISGHVEGTDLIFTRDCTTTKEDIAFICEGVLTNITKVIFRDGAVNLDKEVFSELTNLQDMVFENGSIKSTVDDNIFKGTKITTVEFGEGLESLHSFTFNESVVETVVLPESYENINSAIFGGATKLKTVVIKSKNASVTNDIFNYTSYENKINLTLSSGKAASVVGSSMKDATTNASSPWNYIASAVYSDGVNVCDFDYITNKDGNPVVGINKYNGTSETVNIPYGITFVDDGAFANNTVVVTVNFPRTVTAIGNSVFQNATNLTTVNFNEGLETIGGYIFTDGSPIEFNALTIPSTVASIGDWGLRGVKNVTILNNELELTSNILGVNPEKIIANGGSKAQTYAHANFVNFEHIDASEIPHGDVTDDGEVNIKDLVRYKKYEANKETTYILAQALDVNDDGSTDSADLSSLQKILLGVN